VVEGTSLLRRHTGLNLYREFESLAHRQILTTRKQTMKPTKTFKLSKTAKRMMALMPGPDSNRNQFKRMMIQAELVAQSPFKSNKDRASK
jgi:hypothetical protein